MRKIVENKRQKLASYLVLENENKKEEEKLAISMVFLYVSCNSKTFKEIYKKGVHEGCLIMKPKISSATIVYHFALSMLFVMSLLHVS